MAILRAIRERWRALPPEVGYVLLLFISTRLVLIAFAHISENLIRHACMAWKGRVFPRHAWYSLWAQWDSRWYIQIAREWYPPVLRAPEHQSEYGFFPLYPLLMRGVSAAMRIPELVSGLIVSSTCLILAGIFLYRLVKLTGDATTARRSVKYMFLFPSAFILSGVFSESLFLLLAILSFYFARQQKWMLTGVAGFFLALTRSNGVLIALPLAVEYLLSKHLRWRDIRTDILWLGLVPLGLLAFAIYCRVQTGHADAYILSKYAFHMVPGNPLNALSAGIFQHGPLQVRFNAWFALTVILLLLAYVRRLGVPYWIYGTASIFLPLVYGLGDEWTQLNMRAYFYEVTAIHGIARFSLDIFPLYILFGALGENSTVDQVLGIFLASLQAVLMVFWCVGFPLVV